MIRNMDTFINYCKQTQQNYHELWNKSKPVVEQIQESQIDPNFLNGEEIWRDAFAVVKANQFYSTSIVGPQGSGKTEIAKDLAARAMQEGFKLIYALPDDFMNNVEEWVGRILSDSHKSVRNCLVADDLSYYADSQTRKNQALVKNLVSRLRHVFKGQMYVIYITHRLHAAPPMLRNSKSWIFSDMQSADRDDAREIIGKSKDDRERLEAVYKFISRVAIEGPRDRNIEFDLEGQKFNFKWGVEENPGDGRLMAAFHSGKLRIYNSKLSKFSINLDDYRYKIPLSE